METIKLEAKPNAQRTNVVQMFKRLGMSVTEGLQYQKYGASKKKYVTYNDAVIVELKECNLVFDCRGELIDTYKRV